MSIRRDFSVRFSAGGHLAASLGIFWDSDFLLMKTGLSKEDIRPAGLILAYPVISSGEYGHSGSFDNLTAGLRPLTGVPVS